jgi:hypothetical protein
MNLAKSLFTFLSFALLQTACLADVKAPPADLRRLSSSKSYSKSYSSKSYSSKSYTSKSSKSSKSKKDKPEELEAGLDSLEDDDNFNKLGGTVWIKKRENKGRKKLVVDYSIKKGPKRCDDCLIAIHKGKDCHDIGSKFYTGGNPYDKDDTFYISNKNGESAGHFNLDNGFNLNNNRCKLVVIYGKGGGKIACGQLVPDGEEDDC